MTRQTREASIKQGEGAIFQEKVSPAFKVALMNTQQRISQKELYTLEEAFQVSRQGLREVFR